MASQHDKMVVEDEHARWQEIKYVSPTTGLMTLTRPHHQYEMVDGEYPPGYLPVPVSEKDMKTFRKMTHAHCTCNMATVGRARDPHVYESPAVTEKLQKHMTLQTA